MAERYSLSPRISYGREIWAPSPLEAAHAFLSNPAKLDREDDAYYKKFMFRKTMVVVACLLAAVVVVAHWSTAVRFLLFLLRRSRRSRRSSGGGQAAAEDGEEEDIANRGMVVLGTFKAQQEDADSRALRPIQMVQFGKMGSGGSGGECMICLSEFHNSEKIGLLPDCRHGFHRPCIEMWLFTHSNCPICRHSLVEEEA